MTILLLVLVFSADLLAQGQDGEETALKELIADYARARETKDSALLRKILVPDIDQLVSSGEWRRGIEVAIEGMMRSSTNNPGERILTVENIRFPAPGSAIVDCRYEIHNPDGSVRRMWSTFIAVEERDEWRIAAIRNMLPR